ncbi:hypothetical protein CPMG_00147 [Prochlorococcus phage MED4-213]|uniref:Uncharacterized protein n=1 Tax=Prochlorococcus phage MED4-213 TaxID=889956 RepID=M4QDL1_9CAUD|nr:hypothetical protein CPMG_00147 [Prochlorococcus phage MED4-213]AGH26248.1 hypothetical protein CPMG_00147 [Prochlorococcus phage MED4-213]
MDWTRFIIKQQTKLEADHSRRFLPIHRALFRTRSSDSHDNTERNHRPKRHRKYKHILKLAGALAVSTATCLPSYATDVGGVSATANPVANSSGSVTNQAIQVLQGPYITNTYGDGIQCQGATANFTPYITRTGTWQDPYEAWFNDPVYNMADNNDDNIPDNPGEILYYVPTRTGQKSTQNINIGFSATFSIPLDKKAMEQCKQSVDLHNEYRAQIIANKRLDFEIARLKNCGEMKKAGIVFHPKSPYYSVCADIMLINPPGVVGEHKHSITTNKIIYNRNNPKPNGDASTLKEISIGN